MKLTAQEVRLRARMGRRLRRMRGEQSLRTLGRVADLSYSYLAEVEAGQKSLTVIALARLTRALGCSLHEFAQEISALDRYRG